MLPDIDGVELCRRLREWTQIPVIVLSAVGDEEAKVRALAAGADDYVTKPFGPRELIARLEANMRRSEPEREPATITTGDLTIDLAARMVTIAGTEVRLTPTEFGLLALLARNRGRLMTHRDLLTGVWGPGYEPTPRSCAPTSPTSAASWAAGGSSTYIRTDPGVGYRFAA